MPSKVAVIGAGPLGLMALKNFKDDGFEVKSFEKRGYIGGLWKPSGDSSLSVVPGTVFNTSRFRAAISDFPFPDDTNDFPPASQLHAYLEKYCDCFDLRPLIQLNTEVKDIKRIDGEWALEIVTNGASKVE